MESESTADKPELPLLSKPRQSTVQFIDTVSKLGEAVEMLKHAEGPFALDAERASGFKYSQRAYLIQVHRAGTPIFLIDPIAITSEGGANAFDELALILRADTWILHAATQDIPCLRELGITAETLFDTELGARLAGLPRVGLGAVTEEFLKVRLAKEHSAVDWSIRPLNEDWLTYAALDVDVLIELKNGIEKLLADQGKLDWANEEFAAIVSAPPKPPKLERWRGVNGMHEIKTAGALAIVRSLWTARENLAEKLDVSPGRLIPDASIVYLATHPAKSKPELASNKSFSGRASRTYLDTWWSALQEGVTCRDLPPLRLPATGMPNYKTWAKKFPEAHQRLQAVRACLIEIAEQNQLPVENLLTPDFARTLCWDAPAGADATFVREKLSSLGARQWQVDLVAADLATALREAHENQQPEPQYREQSTEL